MFKKVIKIIVSTEFLFFPNVLICCSKEQKQRDIENYYYIRGPRNSALTKGGTFVYHVVNEHEKQYPIDNFVWTSDDETVARISKSGYVIGISTGETKIHCFDSKTHEEIDKVNISVLDDVSDIVINGENEIVYNPNKPTQVFSYTSNVYPVNANNNLDWFVKDPKIAKIVSTNPSVNVRVQPLQPGETTLIAKATLSNNSTFYKEFPIKINEKTDDEPTFKIVGSDVAAVGTIAKYHIEAVDGAELPNVKWSINCDPNYRIFIGEKLQGSDFIVTIKPNLGSDIDLDFSVQAQDVAHEENKVIKNIDYNPTYKATRLYIPSGSGTTFDVPIARTFDGNNLEINVISSVFQKNSESSILRPVHKEIKKDDFKIFEIVDDDESQEEKETLLQYGNDYTLSSNKITILADHAKNHLKIEYYGSEISDWVSWDDIQSISNKDVDDEEHNLVYNYFNIGDYKPMFVTTDLEASKSAGHVRLIGMYQDKFINQKGSEYVDELCPTTWDDYDYEFEKVSWYHERDSKLWYDDDDEMWTDEYLIPPWDDKRKGYIRNGLNQGSYGTYDQLTTRKVRKNCTGTPLSSSSNGNEALHPVEDDFWILSVGEIFGANTWLNPDQYKKQSISISGDENSNLETMSWGCPPNGVCKIKEKVCELYTDLLPKMPRQYRTFDGLDVNRPQYEYFNTTEYVNSINFISRISKKNNWRPTVDDGNNINWDHDFGFNDKYMYYTRTVFDGPCHWGPATQVGRTYRVFVLGTTSDRRNEASIFGVNKHTVSIGSKDPEWDLVDSPLFPSFCV